MLITFDQRLVEELDRVAKFAHIDRRIIMDIDDVGDDIGVSARIPAASYKSLIRIAAEEAPPTPLTERTLLSI